MQALLLLKRRESLLLLKTRKALLHLWKRRNIPFSLLEV
jgi:hypothetical protein